YTALGAFLTYATTFTCLEVLHVALGLVKTSIGPTFTQAFGRTWTVWGVLYTLSTSRSSFAFTGLALAWSISEVVRYSFYVSNLIYGKPLGFVQWARYNLFIVLYPLGAGCEWWLMWRGLGEAREWWGLYAGWMVFSMAVYPLLFPGQYWYMVKQRRKVMKARREEVERKGQ
ncbi:protein-tyrosine phosphatase-like protein, partial [Ascobolus immersus RN42]